MKAVEHGYVALATQKLCVAGQSMTKEGGRVSWRDGTNTTYT